MPHRVAIHRPEHECELAPDCLHCAGVPHHQGQEADTVPVQTQVLQSGGVETDFETFSATHLPEGLGHEHLYPLGVEVPDRPGVRVQVPRGPALATVEWSRDQLWTNHSSPGTRYSTV